MQLPFSTLFVLVLLSLPLYIHIYIYTLSLHHLWSITRTSQPLNRLSQLRPALTVHPWSNPHPDRADVTPTDPACPRHHATQPFYAFTQSFCYIVTHFLILVSHLLHSQPFCYSELSHSATVNLVILASVLSHFVLFSIICYSECIHFCCSAQINHFSIMLSPFVILSAIFLWCSVILVNLVILLQ
jgi:hypothetical protein